MDGSRVVSERGRPRICAARYSFRTVGTTLRGARTFTMGACLQPLSIAAIGYPRGLSLNVYAPGFYYGPGFYGWAYNPMGACRSVMGGDGEAIPWYGYYGGYFSAVCGRTLRRLLLADGLHDLADDLQAAYAAHQEAGEADGAPGAAGVARGTDAGCEAADCRRGEKSNWLWRTQEAAAECAAA
jgi:hypothetical protein